MDCVRCGKQLEVKKDLKYETCLRCRNKAFNRCEGRYFDGHTEAKGRKTNNLMGVSAAEYATGQMNMSNE